jgi:RHS repeat-associated protein
MTSRTGTRPSLAPSRTSVAVVLALAMAFVGLAQPPQAAAATAASPITYVYDELGRLEAVIDPDAPSNGVATYAYDDNGNILSITRSSHTSTSIIDLHGNRGEVGDKVTIYGTAFNATVGSNEVRFTTAGGTSGSGGQLATVLSATTTMLTVSVPSGSGDGPIWVRNTTSGQTVLSTESFDFLGSAGSNVPTISSFTPTSGDVGTSVTISGSRFSTDPSLNVVTFNDSRAVVTAATATQLTATVPPGATTGAIEVRTIEGIARSSADFLLPLDKKTSVVPPSAIGSNKWRTTIGGSQAITLGPNAKGVVLFQAERRDQVALSFTGYSGGGFVEVTLLDPFDLWVMRDLLGSSETYPNQTLPYDGDYAVLLRSSSSGTKNFTLTIQDHGQGLAGAMALQPADDSFSTLDPSLLEADLAQAPEPTVWDPAPGQPWTTGEGASPFEWIRLLRAAEGVTAISGQVLSTDGYPLEGVEVSTDGTLSTTDRFGRFLLQGIAPGNRTLLVDGSAADAGDLRFASFEVGVRALDGRTVELGEVFWMPRLDDTATAVIPAHPRPEVVLQHPAMPGLEVHVRRGSKVTGPDGEPVSKLTLMPVPLDRPPFPVPSGVGTPVYWTLQPGPVHIHGPGAWVSYPNVAGLPPGARVDLWYYEPGEGWEVFGQGTVDASGAQISGRSSPIHYLDGVMAFGGLEPPGKLMGFCRLAPREHDPNPARPSTPEPGNCAGDPVDAGNGLFKYSATDLSEPGPMPNDLTRVYRQDDSNMYIFGRGVTMPEQMGLDKDPSPGNSCVISLLVPGEPRVRFVSPNYPSNPTLCDTDAEARTTPLVASGSPGAFTGATLRFVDLSYGPVFYDKFWLVERRDGTVYQFDYPSSSVGGRLIRMTDPTGNTKIVDVSGTAVWKINSIVAYPSARWLNLSYSVIIAGQTAVTSASDAAGRTVNYTYESYADSGGGIRLQTVTDAEQSVLPPANQKKTTYGWNSNHTLFANPSTNASPATQLLTITDPRNNVALTNVFDSSGRIDSQTLANSGGWDYEYSSSDPDCSGDTKVTAPAGGVSCLHVNADGFLTEETVALGTADERTFSYTRDATTKAVTDITDSFHSRVTHYTYSSGNVASITRLHGTADAVTNDFSYDPTRSVLESVTDPLTHATTFDHDAEGCLTGITDAISRLTAIGCTGFGGFASVERYPNGIAQPGVRTSLTYARGDLIQVETDAGPTSDPNARTRTQRFFVDNAGNVRLVRDPLHYETALAYDRLNRLTSVTDASGESTSFEYDPNGNLTKITDPRNNFTEFAYDEMNQMFERTDQLGELDSYTFDENGNVEIWTDRLGNVMVYCYDALDRVTFAGYATTDPSPSCSSTFESTLEYDYDGGGRLVGVDDTAGGNITTITRAYDDLDRMTLETTSEGEVSSTWDDAGRRETMTVDGQPTVSYGYLDNNLLEDIARSTETVSFAYDQANRLDATTLPNSVVSDQTLDAAGDPTQIAYTGGQTLGALSYSYDGAGRRHAVWDAQARIALPAATTSNAVYDAANRLSSWNGATLDYDDAGNLVLDGSQTYTWSARGQLTATSAGTSSFAYDAFGRRTSSTISGTSRRYLYDGWNLEQEQDGTGAVFANSIFGFGPDEVFWRKPVSGSASNYLVDALGSVVALADGSGASTTTYTYQPHGEPVNGDLSNPFTFTGREWNSSIGLQQNRARYYSPAHGRFTAEDPIGESGGLNLYQYAAGAPTFGTDPFGLDPLLDAGFEAFVSHDFLPPPPDPFWGAWRDACATLPPGLGWQETCTGSMWLTSAIDKVVSAFFWAADQPGLGPYPPPGGTTSHGASMIPWFVGYTHECRAPSGETYQC